jgi:DNA ligase 1
VSNPCFSSSRRRALASVVLGLPCIYAAARTADSASANAVALLSEAPADLDPTGYLVSEKFDGVRGVWDGTQLRFRSGRPIAAPGWFTATLPTTALDGELWAGRGRFEAVSAMLRHTMPRDVDWRALQFMVFDAPDAARDFARRAARVAELVRHIASPQLVAVEHTAAADRAALQQRLAEVVAGGGEGLVLRRADGLWAAGRNPGLLKFKPLHDAEAQVLAHEPGHGRLAASMGALRVRTAQGTEFRIGTGFTDRLRHDPPPLGSWITFTHRGVTATGVPRFASYLRQRDADI